MAATRTRRTAAKKTAAKKTPAKAKVSREPTKAQTTKLVSYAREINVRLEKAEGMDEKATDHRLAAAIQLSNAKELCKEAGVGFKKWCEENVEWSYETARKLVRIGAADDPAGMLEDLRERTAIQMRESRVRAAAKTPKAIAGPTTTESPQKIVTKALASMDDTAVAEVLNAAAKKHGLAPVGVADDSDLGDLRHAVAAFDALSAVDKLHLLAHAARATGADISIFDEDIEDAAEAAAAKADEKPKQKAAAKSKSNSAAAPSRRRRASSQAAA